MKRRQSLPIPSILLLGVLVVTGLAGFFFWQNGKVGKFERFNLVLAVHPVTVVSLDQAAKTATIVTFPDDLFISQVVPKLGGYKISSIYKVGELDHRGGTVLAATMRDYLGIPIDGYLFRDAAWNGGIKGFLLSPATIFGGKSDLNAVDLGRLAFMLSQVRTDQIKVVDLRNLATPLLLADGSTAQGLDKDQLDSNMTSDFVQDDLITEKLRVEVVNSTLAAGLGTRAARILTNLGLSVVNVGTNGENLAGCEVRSEKKNWGTVTVLRVANVFGCKIKEQTEGGRADVSLVLGQDFAAQF